MIIVNQDKTVMVNFDNVDHIELIELKKLPVNEIGYAIGIETSESYFNRFAIYDTEERAKEVLAEITEFWKNGAMTDYKGFICYEMPED